MTQPPQAIVMQVLPASPAGSVGGMSSPSQMLPGVPSTANTAQVNSPTPVGSTSANAQVLGSASASTTPAPLTTGNTAATPAGTTVGTTVTIPPKNTRNRPLVWQYIRQQGRKILPLTFKLIAGAIAIIVSIWGLKLTYWSADQQLKQSCMNDKMLNLTTTPACAVALSTPTKHFKRLVGDVTPPITQASYIAMSTPVQYFKHLLFEDEKFLPAVKKLLQISSGLWIAIHLYRNLDNAQHWIRGAMTESSIGSVVVLYLFFSCLPTEQEKELSETSVIESLSETWPNLSRLILLALLIMVVSIRNSLHLFGRDIGRQVLIILICIIVVLTIDILLGFNMVSGSSWFACIVILCGRMLMEPEITLGMPLLYESPNGDLLYAATSKDGEQIVKGNDGKWTLLNEPNPGRFIHWKLDRRLFQESKAVIDGRIASYPEDRTFKQELRVRANEECKSQLIKAGAAGLILCIVLLVGTYGDDIWDKLHENFLAIHARLWRYHQNRSVYGII